MLAAGLAAAGAAVVALTAGGADPADGVSVSAVADAAPGYAVENFAYPQAGKILEEQGIVLKRGDGHIVLADCASQTGLLEVWPRGKDKFCLRVTGDKGYLSLEVPAVYGVKGNDYQTEVNMIVDGVEKTFEVDENAWTPVGETADPDEREHMLVEIITSK